MNVPNSKTSRSLRDNQTGLVSILVTIMIMFVITLIVLTFAKIIRREQRQALDRQLNTQAFYAAESGINDAIEAINGGFKNSKLDCAPFPTAPPVPATNPSELQNSDVDGPNNVSYTCLTINAEPTSLVFDDVDPAQSTIVPIVSTSASPITSITLSWETPNKTDYSCQTLISADAFPSNGSPACDTAVLRVDVVPVNNLIKRGDLLTANKALFLIPAAVGMGGSGSVDYATAVTGDKRGVECPVSGAPRACQVTIGSLPASTNIFYLRIRSIYASSSLTVTADSGGVPVKLKDAQAIVDSTGKANDVLRRVQVRVPLQKTNVPDYALQSYDTICKRLEVNGPNVLPDLTGIPTTTPSGNSFPVDPGPCTP